MSGHAGVLGGPHVVVGDVHVRVADAAELHVDSDVQLAPDIPLDVDLLELGVLGGPREPECGVHDCGGGGEKKWADNQQLSASMLSTNVC